MQCPKFTFQLVQAPGANLKKKIQSPDAKVSSQKVSIIFCF